MLTQPLDEFAHQSYTLKQNKKMVLDVEDLITVGRNITSACALTNIEQSISYRWKKALCVLPGQTTTIIGTHVVRNLNEARVIFPTDEILTTICKMPVDE